MVSNLIKKITSWSYSRWTTYRDCPFKAKCSIILRIKEPSNDAMDRGTEVHQQAQDFTEGKIKSLPPVLGSFREDFKQLKKARAICEVNWAFTKDWEPCAWDDWNRCWVRIKTDAHYLRVEKNSRGVNETTVVVIDHKTGKKRDEHREQRSLYALGAFLTYPDAVAVEVYHWYLDSGEEGKDSWKRESLPALQKLWIKNTAAMLNDTRFAPRPGRSCQWCYYSKNGANRGPCEF